MNRRRRIEPQASRSRGRRACAGVDFDFAARDRPVGVLGAERRRSIVIGQTWPAAAEQGAQPVDGGEEVAACTAPSSRAAGCRRCGRRAAPCSSIGSRASSTRALRASLRASASAHLQHVAGRQHAELVAQLAGDSAAVEHRDDGVEIEPGIVLETAEQARQPGAAAETPDLQIAQAHAAILPAPPSPTRSRLWRHGPVEWRA